MHHTVISISHTGLTSVCVCGFLVDAVTVCHCLTPSFLLSSQKEREKKKEEKKKEKDADKVERHNNTKVQMVFMGKRLHVVCFG